MFESSAQSLHAGGSVDASGHFTAPSSPGDYMVRATSVEDGVTYGESSIIVGASGSGGSTLQYDLNGNLVSDGKRTFEWDAENRLVSVTITATGHRSEFGYDGMGRRVAIRELDPDQTQTLQVTSDTKYLWDGVQIVQSRTSDGGTVLQQYFQQGFVDSDGTGLYYTRDHLGSIIELTDGTEAIRARYSYDPWGRMTQVQGDRTSVFGYAGYFWHAQSGLDLTILRAYDPNLGRWISRDPIGEIGGIDLYAYVSNSTVNLVDNFGDSAVSGGGGAYIPSPYTGGIPVGGQCTVSVDSCGNIWITISVGIGTPGPTWGISYGPDPAPGWDFSGSVGGKRMGVSGPSPSGGFGSGGLGANLNGSYTFLLVPGHRCDKPNNSCSNSSLPLSPGDTGLPLMPVLEPMR
jgi:RHS repeat-associated protein